MEVLGFRELSWLDLLVKPWECRGGFRLSTHKRFLTLWDTLVPKVSLKDKVSMKCWLKNSG